MKKIILLVCIISFVYSCQNLLVSQQQKIYNCASGKSTTYLRDFGLIQLSNKDSQILKQDLSAGTIIIYQCAQIQILRKK